MFNDNQYNNASSAQQLSEMIEAGKRIEQRKRLDEQNSPTNQGLVTVKQQLYAVINQNENQITLLKEQNVKLEEQLNRAIESEKLAKKDALKSRILSYITTSIAVLSLVATIIIAVLK